MKMTPNKVSNYLLAQLYRTVVGEGGEGRRGISETGWSTFSKIT